LRYKFFELMDNENTPVDPVAEATPVVEVPTEAVEAVVEVVVETASQVEPEPVIVETAHDDFDWSIGKQRINIYSKEERVKFLGDYEKSLRVLHENVVVKGKVTAFSSGDVVLDINHKSDGLVSTSEFRDMPDLKIGDEVDVYVELTEDDRGQLVLSRRKAKLITAWDDIVDSYENGTILKGLVVSKTKGGLIVDCNGLETFLPGSQIDIKPIIDYDAYVNKTMEFKVVKINEAIKNAVVSHKALIESDLAEQREAIIGGLEKGQVLEGVVKNITDFGAFMDLGGVDGLLYITDISWGRINHPSEVLELNQKVNVVVLDFDENKRRISLGLKQLQPHPWDVLDAEIKEGSVVKGQIVNIEDYGAFLEIIPGVEGLIHVSEVNWSTQPVNARSYFDLGTEYEAKIVTIDREDRKMSLSIKQLSDDPWATIAQKFPVESQHEGEVKNLTPYGVFVELEEGIGGMIHISDLSWTKRFNHPSEYTKVGDNINVIILDIEPDERKLALGHKQLEENPWDTFENVFPVGSYHEVTLIKKDDRGAIVQLPYGLEAYAPIRHIKKEDNSTAEVDEQITVKVIEFNRDDKRIVVSHSRYVDDIKRKADDEVRRARGEEVKEVRRNIQNVSTKMEKTTLGELDVFSQLKNQMAEAEAKSKAKKEAAAKIPPVVEEKKAEEKVEAPKAEEKKEEVKAEVIEELKEAPEAKKKATEKGDDLKKIEGIGPKIAQLLVEAGIDTFVKLAGTEASKIAEVLEAAGSRYKMHDPATWPQQSQLAADGNWDELSTLQDELKGGR
jgi:small subunit ribosomal protein S1